MLPHLTALKTDDFVLTGKGNNPAWKRAEWLTLSPIGSGPLRYETKAKVLWSKCGIYFLFDCQDEKIIAAHEEDFQELYMGDVVEVFLWPCKEQIVYFEYEVTPLNHELPLMVAHDGEVYHGWLPFKFRNERKILHLTSVRGGEKKAGASITGWTAELMIPWELLKGLRDVPPSAGSVWRMNLCRNDYGSTPKTQWSWSTDDMTDFHNYSNFGSIELKE